MKKNLFCLFFFLLFTCVVFGQSTRVVTDAPYVIVVSFDGFRHDYLDRKITPTLNQLAQNGARATSLKPTYPSKTFPNHISILTGMYPENHGVLANYFLNPFTNEKYYIGDSISVKDPKWYQGEFFWETARRNGIRTASYFWPGSEMTAEYRQPHYFKTFQRKVEVDSVIVGVVAWLNLPDTLRPHFITLYFLDADDAGHHHGPESPELNNALKRLDSIAKLLTQAVATTPVGDKVNFIFVSDHGMSPVSANKAVYLPDTIAQFDALVQDSWEITMVEPRNKQDIPRIYDLLKASENHYKVYYKKDFPKRLHFDKHPFIGSLIILPDEGYVLASKKSKRPIVGGTHGYDNAYKEMHGIFVATGPVFKSNYTFGVLDNIDIYPLLCRIFDINPRANIDGKDSRVKRILK